MKFEKYFQLASLSLICSGFLSILLTGTIEIPAAVVFMAALFIGWFRKPVKIRKLYQWLATGLILLLFLSDLLFFSRLVIAVIKLMMALIILKVFTREEKRDYSTLYLLSFSLLLIASTSTISALFVLSAVAVLFTFVFSLILFEMRDAYLCNQDMEFSPRKTIQATLAMTIIIILLAVPIFLVIPRTALGMFGQTQVSSIGFSPTVNLGNTGNMLENGEVVMRIYANDGRDAVPPDMKWRGVAMDHFDGKSWLNTFSGSSQVIPDLQGRYLLHTDRFQNEMLIEQTVYIEPFSNVIFTVHNPIQLSGFARSFQVMEMANQALYLQPKPNKALQYTLYSDIHSRTRRIKAYDENARMEKVSDKYLQLPEIDPRIKPLAETIVKNATSSLAKVLLLEGFLRTQFEYSLTNSSGNSPDPLGNFLFASRSGHCEYFATAHIIMLRTLGIPARMINGFRQGEYNEWGDYFIVRQSDAHSWVEAYLPGSGWVEFDPTPARSGAGNFSLTRMIGKILDNLDILWTEVVTFDRYKQFGFFRILVRNAVSKWDDLNLSARNLSHIDAPRLLREKILIRSMLLPALLTLLLILTGILLWLNRIGILFFFKKRLFRLNPDELVKEYYRDMLRVMKAKGCEKLPAETPREFLARIRAISPVPYPELITEVYIKTRFGGFPAGSDDLRLITSALLQLRKTEKIKNPGSTVKTPQQS